MMMHSVKRRRSIGRFFTYLILLLLAFTFLLPLLWMIRSSLMGMKQIFLLPPQWIPDPMEYNNYFQEPQ